MVVRGVEETDEAGEDEAWVGDDKRGGGEVTSGSSSPRISTAPATSRMAIL